MLGTPHGQNPSLGSKIRHNRVGPTYPFGQADRPDFAVISTVVSSPPPAPRRRPPSPRAQRHCLRRSPAAATRSRADPSPAIHLREDELIASRPPHSRFGRVTAGVDHQRHAKAAAHLGDGRGRLDHAAVTSRSAPPAPAVSLSRHATPHRGHFHPSNRCDTLHLRSSFPPAMRNLREVPI
jgi:hypothetical protein